MAFQNNEQSVIMQNSLQPIQDEKNDEQKEDEEKQVYCLCKQPYEDEDMIACDDCNEYYHIECIGMSQQEFQYFVERDDEYFCKSCLKDAS